MGKFLNLHTLLLARPEEVQGQEVTPISRKMLMGRQDEGSNAHDLTAAVARSSEGTGQHRWPAGGSRHLLEITPST